MQKLIGPRNICALVLLFSVTAAPAGSQTFTTLFNFDNLHGAEPTDMSLVQGFNGNFFGTTAGGGSPECNKGCGTIFEITPAGGFTTLYYFTGPDGSTPHAGLVQGPDGTFYGTTEYGGANGYGTVFKFTPAGGVTTLHSFNSTDGATPWTALVFGPDANLYGTTLSGGSGAACTGGCGTVFSITRGGTLTSLYSMNYADGQFPTGALVLGSGPLFYGTTEWGGANGYGIVFSITRDGTLTTLYSFSRAEDHWPTAPMVAADGYLYGTNSGGDLLTSTRGNVCKITPSGELTTMYEFTGGDDGGSANGGLIRATDGNFYGTTAYFPENALGPCGFYGCGSVFEVTPDGLLTSLHNFSETDGGNPFGGLVQGTDGDFYGTTAHGGTHGFGTVFRISNGLGPFAKILPAAGEAGSTVEILGTDMAGATGVTFNGISAAFTVVSNSHITATVPVGATTGFVRVVTPGRILSGDARFDVAP